MARLNWRAPDDLLDRVREAAAAEHRSINELLTRIAEAATNPDPAAGDWGDVREQLERAGIRVPNG